MWSGWAQWGHCIVSSPNLGDTLICLNNATAPIPRLQNNSATSLVIAFNVALCWPYLACSTTSASAPPCCSISYPSPLVTVTCRMHIPSHSYSPVNVRPLCRLCSVVLLCTYQVAVSAFLAKLLCIFIFLLEFTYSQTNQIRLIRHYSVIFL